MRFTREAGLTLPETLVVAGMVVLTSLLLWNVSQRNVPTQGTTMGLYNAMLARAHDEAPLNDGMTLAFTPAAITLYLGRPSTWPLTQVYSVALPAGETVTLQNGATSSTSFAIIVDPAGTIAPVPSWTGSPIATEPACMNPVSILFSDGPGGGVTQTISCIDARFN